MNKVKPKQMKNLSKLFEIEKIFKFETKINLLLNKVKQNYCL